MAPTDPSAKSKRKRPAKKGVKRRRTSKHSFTPELKWYDTGLTTTAIATDSGWSGTEVNPSATSMISTPALGDAGSNRDGQTIRIKSISVKGNVQRAIQEAAVDPAVGATCWVALVLDKQTNGAQLNGEDVLSNVSAATLGLPGFRNLLFAKRFQILRMIPLELNFNGATSTAANVFSADGVNKSFDIYVPCDIEVNFNSGTTASVVNVVDKSVHLLANSTVTGLFISYAARIRFTDH